MPSISLIVPVYKVEDYLPRCVDSILHQSFSDFELILVDDGSPDHCGEICDQYAQEDDRVHVIHQKNGGLSAARNAGIDWAQSYSDSQWIAFVDSDDWVHRDYLKILLSGAEKYGAQISACDFFRTDHFVEDSFTEYANEMCLNPEKAYVEYYGKCMTACCKLYRKELFQELRFPVGKLHEDAFVTHILTFTAKKICVCELPLYYYYTNPNSITRMKWSPKRLQEIEAHEVRLQYLKNAGCQAAYKCEVEVYVDTLAEQAEVLLELCQEDASYRVYLKQLQKKIRRTVCGERKLGRLTLNSGSIWAAITACPVMAVWKAAKFLKRLRDGESE